MLIPRPSTTLGGRSPTYIEFLSLLLSFMLFVIPFPPACVLKVGEIFWKFWIQTVSIQSCGTGNVSQVRFLSHPSAL